MRDNLRFLSYINAVVFSGVAFAAWRLHRRLRTESSRWLLITFSTLAGIVVVSLFLPPAEERTGTLLSVIGDLIIIALMFFPYALFRFTAGFKQPPRALHGVALGAFVGLAVYTLAVPPLPSGEGSRPLWALIYITALMVYWTGLSAWVAGRLWRAGRLQPGVARRRMQMLAVGTLLLNVALLISAAVSAAGQSSPPAVRLVSTSLVWASAASFLFGFAPPGGLRHAWRQTDERKLRRAEASLMTASTPEEVANTIVPHVADLLGGHGAALLDADGQPIAAQGFSSDELAGMAASRAEQVDRDRAVLPLQAGTLVVKASSYAPFFGVEEIELLRSLGTFVDLALSRIRLYDREQETRKELERTNEELTALVYGISHDLRSPIVTVIGYLELLGSDAADQLDDDARHYLERISVSARYMDALIRDLLELSRIGRTQTEPEPVGLSDVVEDIAAELRRDHPAARFEIADLPVVWVNPVRARQLFTNLMENAVRHGGRDDITVSISADRGHDDEAILTVSDDGVGIPEAYRERVFGIFERLDSDVGSGTTGTGIGLAMCRKIVEQMDGSIWIDPAPAGTTFKIALPAAPAPQSTNSVEVQRQ